MCNNRCVTLSLVAPLDVCKPSPCYDIALFMIALMGYYYLEMSPHTLCS